LRYRRGGLAVSASGRWRWSPGRITDLRSASPSAQATPARHAERDDRGRHCVAAAYNLVRVREPMEETASPGPFAGRCRIIGMDDWDDDFLALVEEAHLTFDDKSGGKIGFGVSKDFLNVRYHAISKGDASERVASQWT
jgi:hypothetical protein